MVFTAWNKIPFIGYNIMPTNIGLGMKIKAKY
jgi:hypothetical protein